jgi:exodeoxyribonuclease VII small subunit
MTGHLNEFIPESSSMPKAKSSSNAVDAMPVSYEAAMQELEALTLKMESGQLPLDQLLSGYTRGAELLTYCRAQLDAVEQQIKVLDNGVLKPWNDA